MYGAIRPEMSEYFLAGKNDGGAFIDESKNIYDKVYILYGLILFLNFG